MPKPWNIPTIWKNQKVFIIGGGPSLSDMDWEAFAVSKQQKGFKVIGCNDAYLLGDELVDICLFGDGRWYWEHKEGLKNYSNPVVTNDNTEPGLLDETGIHICKRETLGFNMQYKDRLGWYYNTGITAIELAYRMGSTKVVLLGFDMKLGENGEGNWHENLVSDPDANRFNKFKIGTDLLQVRLNTQNIDMEIYNANPSSAMDAFTKVTHEGALEI